MTDQSGLPPNYKQEGLLGVYTIGSYHFAQRHGLYNLHVYSTSLSGDSLSKMNCIMIKLFFEVSEGPTKNRQYNQKRWLEA